MESELGWLRKFASDLRQWQECQAVISSGLTFLNESGIFPGVAERFRNHVAHLAHCPMSQQLVQKTVQFLNEHAAKLQPGERLPMSSEILESAFGRFKQFERQHSRSGFTGLLLVFPVLLQATSEQEMNAALAQVKVADVKKWLDENLPRTLRAKRQLMFREAKSKKRATQTAMVA
jgi:hypothetical protein